MSGLVIVNILAALLVISSMLVVLSKTAVGAAKLYAVQSLILIGCFIALGFATGSTELFVWSGTAFLTKVILVPAVLIYAFKKIGQTDSNYGQKITPVKFVILAVVELALCFFVVQGINIPSAQNVYPALAVSLAHFFIGMTCIVTQKNILKQILGYCLMENGSHLTLALLAPQAPELVEIGVATDAVFAVIIMAILAVQIYRRYKSLDSGELTELRG